MKESKQSGKIEWCLMLKVIKKCPVCNSSKFKQNIGKEEFFCSKCKYLLSKEKKAHIKEFSIGN